MTDVLLTADNEFDLTTGRSRIVTGVDAVGQKLRLKLQAFQGDWFLDLLFGIPYFGSVLVKNVNESDLLQIYQFAVESTRGVATVNEINLTLPDSQTRRLDVQVFVTTSTGDELNVATNVSELFNAA